MQQNVHKTKNGLTEEVRKLRQRNSQLESSLAETKRQAEQFQAAFETALDAMIISDQEGTILFWNTAATKLTGYSAEEIVGRSVTIIIPDSQMDAYKKGLENIIAKGVSTFGKTPKLSMIKRKDGTEIPVVAAMSHWKLGDTYYFGGSFRDISEELRTKEERERILNLSQDLICIAGMDGYFKYVNPAWEKTLGYSTEQLLRQPFLDFIHPDDHQKNDEEVARLAAGKLTVNFENRYIHKDGSIRTITWRAVPVPEERLMFCIGRDITEQRQKEQALRAQEEQFRTMAESTIDAIVVIDDTGKIQYCNKSVEKSGPI